MIYYQVQNDNGRVIAGNMELFSRRLDFEENRNFFDYNNGKPIKGVEEVAGGVSVWVVVENEEDLLKSSKLFKKTLGVYKHVAQDVWKYHKTQVGAHAHTLTTIQGQIRQKIEGFAEDEEFYGDSYAESLAKISKQVNHDPTIAADLICYTHKRIADMRAHLLGVEVIHMGATYEVKLVRVRLKKAILNQCTPFLEEMDQNSVKLRFFIDDTCEVEIDKNMFSLAMYNFFSNAAKYTKFDSEIRLHYSDEKKSLDISMISLKMEKSEINHLFQEGVRGKHAKDVAGKGIGLFVLQSALKIMGKAPMYIEANHEKNYPESGSIYNENHFAFSL